MPLGTGVTPHISMPLCLWCSTVLGNEMRSPRFYAITSTIPHASMLQCGDRSRLCTQSPRTYTFQPQKLIIPAPHPYVYEDNMKKHTHDPYFYAQSVGHLLSHPYLYAFNTQPDMAFTHISMLLSSFKESHQKASTPHFLAFSPHTRAFAPIFLCLSPHKHLPTTPNRYAFTQCKSINSNVYQIAKRF